VLVSGDTGPAHMATALGVPRVTIFGPTPPAGWSPGWDTTRVVHDPDARCAGCAAGASASRADLHTCLARVTPEMVLAPVRELLAAARR
jgi:ADP-heptose:LPS heptosyltransferase